MKKKLLAFSTGILLSSVLLGQSTHSYFVTNQQTNPSVLPMDFSFEDGDNIIIYNSTGITSNFVTYDASDTQNSFTQQWNIQSGAIIYSKLIQSTDPNYFCMSFESLQDQNYNPNIYGEACFTRNTSSIDESAPIEVSLSPNPCSEYIHLLVGESQKLVNVSIIDLTGKTVLSAYQTSFEVSALPNGTYLMQIETQESKTTQKFIKTN